jgi:hypothetical protein
MEDFRVTIGKNVEVHTLVTATKSLMFNVSTLFLIGSIARAILHGPSSLGILLAGISFFGRRIADRSLDVTLLGLTLPQGWGPKPKHWSLLNGGPVIFYEIPLI